MADRRTHTYIYTGRYCADRGGLPVWDSRPSASQAGEERRHCRRADPRAVSSGASPDTAAPPRAPPPRSPEAFQPADRTLAPMSKYVSRRGQSVWRRRRGHLPDRRECPVGWAALFRFVYSSRGLSGRQLPADPCHGSWHPAPGRLFEGPRVPPSRAGPPETRCVSYYRRSRGAGPDSRSV